MLTRPSRFVLIGFGRRGADWFGFVSAHPDADVVAVVDPDSNAGDRARALGIDAYDALEVALESIEIDGAIVATPAPGHASGALGCVAAGVGVLVEKPLATSLEDARRVAAAAEQTRRPVLVAQNFRYLPRERAMRDALVSGRLGCIRRGTIDSARALDDPAPLWEFCIHHLDAVRLRFGLPTNVAAHEPARGVISATLTWSTGMSLSYRHDERAPAYRYRERIVGDAGLLTVDDQRVRLARGWRRRRIDAGPAPVAERVILDSFFRTLRGEADTTSLTLGARDNLATIALVAAMDESIRSGLDVEISSDTLAL